VNAFLWPAVALVGVVLAYILASQWLTAMRVGNDEAFTEIDRVKAAIESQQVALNRLDAKAALAANTHTEVDERLKRLAAMIPEAQRSMRGVGR
jgi:hypothetical protein